MIENSVYLDGRSQASVSFSTTAAQSVILTPGVYAVWSDADCYIKTHPTTANDVTTTTGFPIKANSAVMPVRLVKPCKIGAVGAGSGNLYYHQIL